MAERDLEAIEERLEKATPGPWEEDLDAQCVWQSANKTNGFKIADIRGWGYLTGGASPGRLSADEAVQVQDANAAFIAHAPTDIRALLTEVRRLKAIEDLARRMRNVMQDVEWACEGLGWAPACPARSAEELLYPERREHEADCKLAIVLPDAENLLGEGKSIH